MQIDKKHLNLPACLIIMDGFGLSDERFGNAIAEARTPNLDKLFAENSWIKLDASSAPVGLPDGQMGNSEVGHLNIGAGRVVPQELTRINSACQTGDIVNNEVLNECFETCIHNNTRLHLMGLLSDGGVHSSIEHLFALMESAVQSGVMTIRIHAFMDGRDVSPTSGISYIDELEQKIAMLRSENPHLNIKIGSVSGRYYAMDRDNRFDRVEKAYNTLVCADNLVRDLSPSEYIKKSYDEGITDEFIVPASFCSKGMRDGDGVVFFNFRPDRAREITSAITNTDFDGFNRAKNMSVNFVCMTEYDENFDLPIAFPKSFPKNVLADVISDAGLSQLHIAETEKYAHVTFFLNGGIEEEKPGETRILVPSPKVATYDLQPEMSEPEVTEKLVSAIESGEYDFYIVNYANCDMVGHTGSLPAAIKAVEAVDAGVGQVVEAIQKMSGFALITADHGNADVMINADGTPQTAHTTNKVPLILFDGAGRGVALDETIQDGALSDIAPTMLTLAGLDVPREMTGKILVK